MRVIQLAMVLGPLLLRAGVRGRLSWGDEEHFLHSVRLFGEGLSFDLLRAYPEMSGPLTFIVYACWGRLFGFDTATLRLLSPVIAGVTAVTWFRFHRGHLRSRAALWLSLVTLVLNPCFVGLSVFVFTDMLALLGLGLAVHGVAGRAAVAGGHGAGGPDLHAAVLGLSGCGDGGHVSFQQ